MLAAATGCHPAWSSAALAAPVPAERLLRVMGPEPLGDRLSAAKIAPSDYILNDLVADFGFEGIAAKPVRSFEHFILAKGVKRESAGIASTFANLPDCGGDHLLLVW